MGRYDNLVFMRGAMAAMGSRENQYAKIPIPNTFRRPGLFKNLNYVRATKTSWEIRGVAFSLFSERWN